MSAAALAVGVLLAGCAGPVDWTDEERHAVAEKWSAMAPELSGPSLSVNENWWRSWKDEQLSALIERAMDRNTSIRVGLANLRSAAALADQATAALFPTLAGNGGYNRSHSNHTTSERWSASVEGGWSFNLAGGTLAAQRAANYEAMTSALSLEDIKIAVASEVAQNYINLRLAYVKERIAQQTLKNYTEVANIATWRLKSGLVDQSELDQAVSNRESARAQLPKLAASIAQYRAALARLTVQNIEDINLNDRNNVPVAPANLAVSVPAQTLKNRPDMRSAEFAVMAASERVYQAQAQWFPTLKLTGSLGTQAATIGALGASGTGIASLIGALSMPILNWGEQVSATEQRKAALDKARAQYTATLLAALEQTENALQGIRSAQQRTPSLELARKSAVSASDLAMKQYKAGLVDFQTVLNTERTLLNSRQSVEENRADLAQQMVTLYRALGGGWDAKSLDQTQDK